MNNLPWHVDRREITNPQTALSESLRGASQNQSYIQPEMRSLEALKHKNWIRGPSLSECQSCSEIITPSNKLSNKACGPYQPRASTAQHTNNKATRDHEIPGPSSFGGPSEIGRPTSIIGGWPSGGPLRHPPNLKRDCRACGAILGPNGRPPRDFCIGGLKGAP